MELRSSRAIPDFLIIGRPKCGTTSVARWLAAQPDVFFCQLKEPRYFSAEWGRGPEWYSGLYAGARPDQLLGEATPDYTHPNFGAIAAERIATAAPEARLVYLIRHPAERIRSAFRHRRLTAEESAESLLEAVQERPDVYLGYTMYYTCLEPYIERFSRNQLLVIRTEDLSGVGAAGWGRLMDHLGLSQRPRPDERFNLSEERSMYRPVARVLGGRKARVRMAWIPAPVRQLVKRAMKTDEPVSSVLESSRMRLPSEVLSTVWADIRLLEKWMGVDEPLWPEEADARSG